MPKCQPSRGYCTRCEEWKICFHWYTCKASGRRSICHGCGVRAAKAQAKERARAEAAEATAEPAEEDDPDSSPGRLRVDWSPSPPVALPSSETASSKSAANPYDVVLKVGSRLAYLRDADHQPQEGMNSKQAEDDPDATTIALAQLGHDPNSPIAFSDSDDEPLSKKHGNQNQEEAKVQTTARDKDSKKQAVNKHTGGERGAFGEGKEPPVPPQGIRRASRPRSEQTPTEPSDRTEHSEDKSQEAANEDTEQRDILLAAAEREVKRHQRQVDLMTDLQDALKKEIDRTAMANRDNFKLRTENRRQHNEIQDLKKQREPEEALKELNRKRILDLELESEGKQLQIDHLEKRVRRLKEGAEKWYERMKEEDTCQ